LGVHWGPRLHDKKGDWNPALRRRSGAIGQAYARDGKGRGWAGGRPHDGGGLRLLMNEERKKREKNKRLGLVFRVILKKGFRMRWAELDKKGSA
jgi:hypothetical protein